MLRRRQKQQKKEEAARGAAKAAKDAAEAAADAEAKKKKKDAEEAASKAAAAANAAKAAAASSSAQKKECFDDKMQGVSKKNIKEVLGHSETISEIVQQKATASGTAESAAKDVLDKQYKSSGSLILMIALCSNLQVLNCFENKCCIFIWSIPFLDFFN